MMAPNNDYWDIEYVLVDMTSTGKEYRANDQLKLFKTMPELDPFGEEAYEKSFKPYLKNIMHNFLLVLKCIVELQVA